MLMFNAILFYRLRPIENNGNIIKLSENMQFFLQFDTLIITERLTMFQVYIITRLNFSDI